MVSPNEFEVVLYLNQMGVFNFVDDGTLPGCAVLKVCCLLDGAPGAIGLLTNSIIALRRTQAVNVVMGRVYYREWLLECTQDSLSFPNTGKSFWQRTSSA